MTAQSHSTAESQNTTVFSRNSFCARCSHWRVGLDGPSLGSFHALRLLFQTTPGLEASRDGTAIVTMADLGGMLRSLQSVLALDFRDLKENVTSVACLDELRMNAGLA
jgi:hypothetical protein